MHCARVNTPPWKQGQRHPFDTAACPARGPQRGCTFLEAEDAAHRRIEPLHRRFHVRSGDEPSSLPATTSNPKSLSSTEWSGVPTMIVARQRPSFPAFCEALTMPRIEIDRVKEILITLEDSYPNWRGIDLGIEDDRLRSYYVDFLRKDGLVEANNWGTDQTGDDWKATGLTPDGHRMAEALRAAPANWRERALKSVKAEGWSLTWEMAKKYLWQLIGQ